MAFNSYELSELITILGMGITSGFLIAFIPWLVSVMVLAFRKILL